LYKRLRDPEYAVGYLNAVLENPDAGISTFLAALEDVVHAWGVKETAQRSHLHRVALHKILANKKRPEFESVQKILLGLKLGLKVEPRQREAA
jgi:probable addiction module antidote protein